FDNHTAPTRPDHTSESSNSKENQSLSSSSSRITPPGGTPSFSLSPIHNIHIERRTTMSDKDALFYLKQCKVPARWTLASEFRAMPDSAQNIRNS
ncbi:hypothetical protein HHX47_DHR3001215, partial [Lentinula edodes]